jgi:hypothetical protein
MERNQQSKYCKWLKRFAWPNIIVTEGPLLDYFSAKNLLINSHQAHQIAAHHFHHLPMSLPDDNPSSFGDHYGFGRHAACWVGWTSKLLARFAASCPTFQPITS